VYSNFPPAVCLESSTFLVHPRLELQSCCLIKFKMAPGWLPLIEMREDGAIDARSLLMNWER
jgi:hypothetical protein